MNPTETLNDVELTGQKPMLTSPREADRAFISFGAFGIAVLALLMI